MEGKKITNSDRIKSSLAYIPLVGVFLYFTETNKSDFLSKHIKYGNSLFIGFIVIRIILITIFTFHQLNSILSLIYLFGFGIMAFKVYKGEDVNIEYIDKFEDKIKDEMKDDHENDKDKDKEEKVDHFEEKSDESEIKTGNPIVDSFVGSFNNSNDKKSDSENDGKEEKKNKDILDF